MIKTLTEVARTPIVAARAGLDFYQDVTQAEIKAFGEIARINAELGRRALELWAPHWLIPKDLPADDSKSDLEKLRDTPITVRWNDREFTMRRASQADAPALAAMYDDPDMMTPNDNHMRFFGTYKEPGQQYLRAARLDGDQSDTRYPALTYGMFDQAGAAVGEVTSIKDPSGVVEVAYAIAKPYRGKDPDGESLITTLATQAADTWAADPSVTGVYASVLGSNVKSARILKKVLDQYPDFTTTMQRDGGDYEINASRIPADTPA